MSKKYPPAPEGFKVCSTCGKTKPLTLENFHKKIDSPDGFKRRCKECIQEIRNQPEQKAHDLAVGKLHYARTREKQIAYTRNWQREHAGQERARKIEYRKLPQEREKARQRTKSWYAEHRECARQQNHLYRKQYHREHPEKAYQHKRNRRAREQNVTGTHTLQQVRDQYTRQRGKCYYCQNKILWGKHHVDHTFPLSREGSRNDIDTLVITCPTCNTRKGNKYPWEWPQGGRLL